MICAGGVIICDDLRRGSMLNNGNNDREQNWLLLNPRVKGAQSDWRATVTQLGVHDGFPQYGIISVAFVSEYHYEMNITCT
jgi:hypothetical protein